MTCTQRNCIISCIPRQISIPSATTLFTLFLWTGREDYGPAAILEEWTIVQRLPHTSKNTILEVLLPGCKGRGYGNSAKTRVVISGYLQKMAALQFSIQIAGTLIT